MLIDEPKGNDRGYDSEESGDKPTNIMRYKGLRPININSVRKNRC
jgi:hypothetical protein